jgi:putative salt-induced outer membrane protein
MSKTKEKLMEIRRAFLCLGLAIVIGAAPALADEGETEEEQPEPTWTSNIGLSYVATSGNTDTNTMGLDLLVERKPEPWGLEFRANFNRAEDTGELTAERYFASARAVRTLSERWDFFAGLSGEKDQFAGLDLRAMVESGVTYHALLGPKHLLSFDGGLTWTDEDRIDPEPDVSYFGGIAGLSYEWKFSDTASLTQRLLFYPNFDDSADWRLSSDTGLQVSMTSLLAVKLGYELRYRNEPIGDAKSTDTTTKASLVFTF